MPRVPFQTLTAVRQNEAPIQSGAFQQTAQATSNLMSAIGGAAKTVQAMFDQAQDLKNRSDIMEKRRTIRMAQGEFLNEMAGMQKDGTMGQPIPPEQWGRLWQDRLKNLQKNVVEDKDAPPTVRRNVEEVFKDFSGSSFIQIAGAALKETRRNARQNFDRDYQFLIEEGRTDEAAVLVDENRGTVLTDDEASDVLRNINKVERDNIIRNDMILDPFQTAKDIKEGKYGLSDIAKNKWLEEVDSYQRTQERQALRDANDMIVAGEIEDETQLREFLDGKPEMSETTKKGFIKDFNNTKPLTEVERTRLQDMVDGLREFRTDPKKYKEEFDKVAREFELVGRRSGKPMVNLWNIRPELFTEEKMREMSDEKRAALDKDLASTGRILIKSMVEASVETAYMDSFKSENRDELDPEVVSANKKHNIQKKKEQELQTAIMRGVINRKMEDYLASLPPGAAVNELDLTDWLKENISMFMDEAYTEYARRKNISEPKLKTELPAPAGPTMLPGLTGGR